MEMMVVTVEIPSNGRNVWS